MRPAPKPRADRALERQLDYQRAKSARIAGSEEQIIADMKRASGTARAKLQAAADLPTDPRVLEVGSGAHGLIFYFEAAERVGVDPLADHYRELFPVWQSRARTVACGGESLPFPNESFDIVLCDNVVDHAQNPRRILEEIARVLAPGGLLYFTVNVHHPAWHAAASVHAAWRALGIPIEITPFADHTVHLTPRAARALLHGLPWQILREQDDVEAVKAAAPRIRHIGDRVKHLFFKNAVYEAIAVKS